MNLLDGVLAAACTIGAWIGYRRGLVTQLVSIAGLVLAYLIAYRFYQQVSPWIGKLVPLQTFESYDRYAYPVKALHLDQFVLNALAFALLFFAVKLGMAIVSHVLNLIVLVPGLNGLNRLAGLTLALAETLLLAAVAVKVMSILPSDPVQKLLAASRLAHWLLGSLPSVLGQLPELWTQIR